MDNKEIIIQATIDLINEKGEQMNGITVREICKKANVGLGLVNYHFGNKDKLIELCVERIVNSIVDNFSSIREKAEITEFYLPGDCPSFCTGCVNCILRGEHTCRDAEHIQKIAKKLMESDLIVMTSPAYVMHTTGAMKSLLDHFAYLWMPHRPAPEMFAKRAVIITQCLGAGAKSTAKDIKHSLSWWGISKITVFTGKLMGDIIWEKLAEKKRSELTKKMNRLSEKLSGINYKKPSSVNVITRIKFLICRMMQKSLHKNDPEYLDGKYWAEQGWLGQTRPWRV